MKDKVEVTLSKILEKKILYIIIFFEGFAIMGVELISSNLVAPFYGTNLTVWTFVIGITMFALAIGYFFGGFLSKRKNDLTSIVYFLLFAASVLIYLMPFISTYLFRTTMDMGIISSLILSVAPFLFPPLFCLGSLSPILIKLISKYEQDSIGENAGKVYAISTLAGILSAIVTAFFLIEAMRTYQISFLFSMTSFALLLLIFWKHYSGIKIKLPLLLIGVFILFYVKKAPEKLSEKYLSAYRETYISDGILGQIKIIDNTRSNMRTLVVNNTTQTISQIKGESYWEYVQKINLFINKVERKKNILMAGLGGGNLAYVFGKNNHMVDVIDIDKRMPDLAKKYFQLNNIPNLNFIVDDARHFVNTTDKKYDIIVLDLSAGENAPDNVYTIESFKLMKKSLKKDGLIFIHYYSNFVGDDLLSVKSIGKTLAKTNLYTKLLTLNQEDRKIKSVVFLAGNKKYINSIAKINVDFVDFDFSDGIVLSDDRPILNTLRKNIILENKKDFMELYRNSWRKE